MDRPETGIQQGLPGVNPPQPTSYAPTEPEAGGSRKWLLGGALVLLLVVGIAVFLRVRSGSGAVNTQSQVKLTPKEARDQLRKDTSLTTCRSALHQVNAYLAENPTERPGAVAEEERKRLKEELDLSVAEFAELNSRTFTPLDAHHLEFCFLLRDAADKLPVEITNDDGAVRQLPPLDKATLAFAWMMRQVRLKRGAREEGEGPLLELLKRDRLPEEEDFELENMAFWGALVLRRGTGTPLERSLLFLALLDQLGLDGCLVSDGEQRRPRYWACGVLGEDNQVYLFDTRLGMPLPGPGGKGIATLADVQRDPTVLGQLTFAAEKVQYDVTQAQAGKAELHLVSALSALSPRMKYLQEVALDPAKDTTPDADNTPDVPVKARLMDEPAAARARFGKAQTGNGKAVVVRQARWATGMLRRALPSEEGGTASGGRRELQLMRLAPLGNLLILLPDEAKENIVRNDLRVLLVPPLDNLLNIYQTAYSQPILEPRKPRDLILRGRLDEAVYDLGTLAERLDLQLPQLRQEYDPKQLGDWYAKTAHAYAEAGRLQREKNQDAAQQARAEADQLWREYEKPLTALLLGSLYAPRKNQTVYWRNLALHEKAELAHARVVYGSDKDGRRAQRFKDARERWENVDNGWRLYLEEFGPRAAPDAPAAKRAPARALRGLQEVLRLEATEAVEAGTRADLVKQADEARVQEKSLWEEIAREATDLPKVAALYQWQAIK